MGSVRVLLVEDDPNDAALVERLLDRGQFQVARVTHAAEAAVRLRHEPFDVAVLDVSLPDASGLEAFSKIRESAPTVPIVILSGNEDESLATTAVHQGAQDYLIKGQVSEVSLQRALRYAIERERLQMRMNASIEELERQRASVLHLNQLKNDLVAVLAHDIKGPLTSIVGFAELLEDGYLEGDAAVDAARTIRVNAQRLATLASDVLLLSRSEHGELEIGDERIDLVDLVQNVIEAQGPDRTIGFTHAAPKAIVRGDAARLRQVFDNLIRNAVKYSPAGETVDVDLTIEGNAYRVDVRDRGIGIPPEEMGRLFQRFFRASNAKRAKIAGTGLGLFIVRTLVERHGGQVGVVSEPGKGTTFTVHLPTIETAFADGPKRVVVITGDAEQRRFMAYELRSRGYRVRECENVNDLLSGATVRSGDVIVADASLATPNELRAAVRADHAPRVVGIGAVERDGWDETLQSPFLASELIDAVAPHVHGHLIG